MSIKIRESTMVRPADETPNAPLWLSDVDLIKRTPFTHTPLAYVFSGSKSSNHFDTTLLKTTLSKVLVPFYPMAGRLRKSDVDGRIEIDCNAKGVLFVEVNTTYELSYFGDFTPNGELRKLVIPTCDYSRGLASMPLIMVQLTRFRCGGVFLGFALHHFLGDASSFTHFINSWSRVVRGLEIDVLPVLDRTRVLVPRNPPQVKFDHIEFQPPRASLPPLHFSRDAQITESTKVGLFKFTKGQITALKQKARSDNQEMKYSTFEVLAGHVWRCAIRARNLRHDIDIKLCVPINGRGRFKQDLVPHGYVGNVLFNSTLIAKSGDVATKALWYAASKIHEAVTRIDDEYMRSAVDYLSLQPDLTVLASGPHTSRCPDIHINYWARFIPFYDADFGCGQPTFVRHGGIGYEGQVVINLSNSNENDMFVAVNLFTSHMDRFEKLIYDFDDRRSSL